MTAEARFASEPVPTVTEIALTPANFDKLSSFVSFSAETKAGLSNLHRAAYYSIYPASPYTAENPSAHPLNAMYDSYSARSGHLELYADFFPPFGAPYENGKPESMAVCSFEYTPFARGDSYRMAALKNERGFSLGRQLCITHMQTAKFPSSYTYGNIRARDFNYHLGFIDYQRLFIHIMEQVAWRSTTEGNMAFQYVTLPVRGRSDHKKALYVVEHGRSRNENVKQEMEELENEHLRLARLCGYDVPLRALSSEATYSILGKRIMDIAPDQALQRSFGPFYGRIMKLCL